MRSRVLLLIITGILGAGGGWLYTRLVLEDNPEPVRYIPQPTAADLIGERRPDFTLGATTGERISASDFDGQVVLLNFWATWCAPCRAEMPMLSELSGEYTGRGVQIVGIALDEVQQARDFARELGIAYPILVGTTDVMAAGVVYGNRKGLLPYSVLIDQQGIVRRTWLGELDRIELTEQIELLLQAVHTS